MIAVVITNWFALACHTVMLLVLAVSAVVLTRMDRHDRPTSADKYFPHVADPGHPGPLLED